MSRSWRIHFEEARAKRCIMLIWLLHFKTIDERMAMVLCVAPCIEQNRQGNAGYAQENDDAKKIWPEEAIHFVDEVGDLGWKFARVALILKIV